MKKKFEQLYGRLRSFVIDHKKYLSILGGILLVVLLSFMAFRIFGGGVWVERLSTDSDGSEGSEIVELVTSPTTGQEVLPEIAQRPVIGVMISNSTDARPQSGISNADIVYEAIAEGGITRYLAFFHDQDAPTIGPVRSLRPYYIDWINMYDATAVHVGGSREALDRASSELSGRDIDEFNYGSSVFNRIPQRLAPHNTYTSMQKLLDTSGEIGHSSSSFEQLPRAKGEPVAEDQRVTSVTVPFSSPAYQTSWNYDGTSNVYKRSIAGQPHVDDSADARVTVNSVVVIQTRYNTFQARGNTYSDPGTTGSGDALIFQNGDVIEARWSRKNGRQYSFTTHNNDDIELNVGKLWFAVQPADQNVTYE